MEVCHHAGRDAQLAVSAVGQRLQPVLDEVSEDLGELGFVAQNIRQARVKVGEDLHAARSRCSLQQQHVGEHFVHVDRPKFQARGGRKAQDLFQEAAQPVDLADHDRGVLHS